MKKRLPPRIGFSKRDRKVAVKNGQIIYTKNQRAILDAALQGVIPLTKKEFLLLKDILNGNFKLKYPAKSTGKGVSFADTEETLILKDNPLLRVMESFYSLFGKDFGAIYCAVVLAPHTKAKRDKALKMAERMITGAIQTDKLQKKCKHKWKPFKENPTKFVECEKCELIKKK